MPNKLSRFERSCQSAELFDAGDARQHGASNHQPPEEAHGESEKAELVRKVN